MNFKTSFAKNIVRIGCAVTLLGSCMGLSSCDTATGQGAGFGAAGGAIIGGLTGTTRNAAIGAAAGALTGALIGSAVDADRNRDEWGARSRFPYGSFASRPGFVISPYRPHYVIDTRGIPHGSLVRDPSCGRIFVKP